MRKAQATYFELAVAEESAPTLAFWQRLKGSQRSGGVSQGKWGMGRGVLGGGCWPEEAGSEQARSTVPPVTGWGSTLGFLWLVLHWKLGKFGEAGYLGPVITRVIV